MEQVSELLQCTRQDPSSLTVLVDALQALLQAGHVGNRTVARGDVWGVVVAATRAFPIQLSPSVEKAQEVMAAAAAAAAADGDDHSSSLLHTWILQAAADGSLPVLVQKLRSQPQILTAYARDAPLRQPATVDALVAALQELQALIPVSPYDSYVQAKKAAAAAAGQAAPDQKPPAVHIQTESDLAQQQLPSPSRSTNADAQSGHGSISNGSGQVSAAGASNSPAAASQPAGEQKGLVGRLRSARLPQFGSFSKKGPQQQQQQHGGMALLQVQLLVATPEQLSSAPDRLVQLHVQVTQQQQQQQPDARQQQKRPAGSITNSSSRGTASPPATPSVKGLLQGLQQSAASGLQQAAATAASQDISGAVAAAGGAVAAALGSVKGWNRFEAGRRQQQQQQQGAAAAAGIGTDSSRSSSSRCQPGGRQPAKPPPAAAAAGVAKDNEWRLVAVQLLLRAAEDAAAQGLVQLQLNVLPGPPAAAAAAAAASDTRDAGWSTRGMLDRLRLPRGSASAGSSNSSSRAPLQQHEVAVEALSVNQEGQEQQADAEALLEGGMWSVMSRLKAGSSSMLAARAGDVPAAAAAAEAAAQQLAASAQLLQQQLASCCSAVCAAAAHSKGSLGEESPELLQLIDCIKQLLSHGLNNSSGSSSSSAQPAGANNTSSRGSTPEPGGPAGGGNSSSSSMAAAVKAAATARDMLGGLLMQGRQQSAFGVLQTLQHGSKQQPRLMLGADGIANMKAARSAPPAVKLDLWVRASLNEQLLGVRISTLLANPDALTSWYHPGSLLLQHGSMAAVMQELQELSMHRFALPVEAVAAAAAATAGAAGDKAAGSAPVQQQQGAGMVAAASSRSSSMTSALDPRKYLGGFSVGLGPLRVSSTTAAALPTAAAAAADAGSSGSNAAPSSSSALPTFMWGPDGGGTTSSAPPAAAPAGTAGSAGAAAATAAAAAAAAAATAATGGFFRRRRIPQIKEVRVPPPGSGAVLSREPSSTLSPVSTEGDTAYAEWWSPNNSAQDLPAAVDGGGGGAGRRFGSSNSLRSSAGSSGPLGDGGTPRSPAFIRSASRRSHAGSEASTGATSEAALQLEQDLQAAMCAPLLVEQLSARRSGSGGGGIRRSGSAGWDAAVARAKSSAAAGPTVGLGALSRRSRSPEAAGSARGGSGVGGARRSRHMHKRSSSLNDLPELEALWMDGGASDKG